MHTIIPPVSRKARVVRIAKRLFAGVLILAIVGGGYFGYTTYRSLQNIHHENLLPDARPTPAATSTPTETSPAAPQDGESGRALNFLLLGSDSRDLAVDRGRSDTMMVLHLSADRLHAQLLSIPRDSYVPIPGHGSQKINAAYSYGGAPMTVSTIQDYMGITIDHVIIINFNNFVRLVDAVGGVTVNSPISWYDDSQKIYFKKGPTKLNSYDALHYVRSRHGMPNGDFDREANQQRVIRAILAKIASPQTMSDPIRIARVTQQLAGLMTVDQRTTTSSLVGLAWSMKNTSVSALETIHPPVTGTANYGAAAGDVVLLDQDKMRAIGDAMTHDDEAALTTLAAAPAPTLK